MINEIKHFYLLSFYVVPDEKSQPLVNGANNLHPQHISTPNGYLQYNTIQ